MDSVVTCPTSTCTLVISPYVATQEDYEAVSLIFAAVLTAACIIWGAKQVLNILRNRPEA